MKKILYKLIIILLIGTILISSFFIYKNNNEEKKQEWIFEELIEISKDTEQESENGELNDIEHKQVIENVKIDNEANDIEINISKLLNINKDIVGWIRIENSNINYPVMQTKDNSNYYLSRNFYKQYSRFWNSIYGRILWY
jgi:sortase B